MRIGQTLPVVALMVLLAGCQDPAAPSEETAQLLFSSVESRSAKLDNAADVFPASDYENATTAAVPDAHGNVTTPAGGGNSPLCSITVQGLLPSTTYMVHVDTDGITPGDVSTAGPWEVRDTFVTGRGGSGKYRCSHPIGDGNAVFINDVSTGLTVVISTNVNDSWTKH